MAKVDSLPSQASLFAGGEDARPLPDPAFAHGLLAWYDRHRRTLPWRAAAGAAADPYRVWLSEIMLQQTTVATVTGYFERFTGRWPTVTDLAKAPLHEVLEAWAGLGYYARARNLHACARTVAAMGGRFPDTAEGLRRLPGIGDYTAGAIAAIAFSRAEAAVDGNVERVASRLVRLETPLPAGKPAIRRLAAALVPAARPGDFAQGLMDLGATICLPRGPLCGRCPVSSWCEGFARGDAARFPLKAAKAERPVRRGLAYVAIREDGAVLLRRRPEKGLLGGMLEVPGSAWGPAAPQACPPFPARWQTLNRGVEHTFTHFHLVLTLAVARVPLGAPAADGVWTPAAALAGAALPTLFRKVLDAAGVREESI